MQVYIYMLYCQINLTMKGVDHQKHQQSNKYKAELIQFRKENNLPLEDMDDG